MIRLRIWPIAWLVALVLADQARPAFAADPKFEYGKQEEVKAVEWKASAQLGFILTTGNSESVTVSGGASVSRKSGDNKISLEGNVTYARSRVFLAADKDASGTIGPGEIDEQTSTTANAWQVKARYDRFFGEHNSLYLAGHEGADQIAGKEVIAGAQVGYSRQLYKDADNELVAELGYDFAFESYVVDTASDLIIHSARAFAGYTGKLSSDTQLAASLEGLFNLNNEDTPTGDASPFEDTRLNGKASLTSKIVAAVSVRASFNMQFDNVPAPRAPLSIPYAPGFVPVADKLDTISELSLIVNFL